jgi:hypothetical protein
VALSWGNLRWHFLLHAGDLIIPSRSYFSRKRMDASHEFVPERRRCLRQTVHTPAFASFDGVSGGMILDLSEEGLAMQMPDPPDEPLFATPGPRRGQPVQMQVDLSDPSMQIETTGYIAWADALGRAGVRFSDLPEDARRRLNDWLTTNSASPSHIAPKITVGRGWGWDSSSRPSRDDSREHIAVSLEADSLAPANGNGHRASATVQYEFGSLGSDLTATLRLIADRARTLTRGSSSAIALAHREGVVCRASVGEQTLRIGTKLDVTAGLSGECFREGKTLRCDDSELDTRVDLASCRKLGVRSILAAPIRYERLILGVLVVFASNPFTFDEGDVAVAESLAHAVVRSIRQTEACLSLAAK